MNRPRRGLMHARIIGALAIGLAIGLATIPAAASTASINSAFAKFFAARSTDEAQKAVSAVLTSGATFQDAFDRLRKGRTYSAKVARGVVHLSRRVGGDIFYFDLDVPVDYDPAKTYQVRVQLHGGVNGRE